MKKKELAREAAKIIIGGLVTTAILQSSIGQEVIPKIVEQIEKGRQRLNV